MSIENKPKECSNPIRPQKGQLPTHSFCTKSGMRVATDQYGRIMCPAGCRDIIEAAKNGTKGKDEIFNRSAKS